MVIQKYVNLSRLMVELLLVRSVYHHVEMDYLRKPQKRSRETVEKHLLTGVAKKLL